MKTFCQRLLHVSLPFLFIFGLSACEEAKSLTEAQKQSQHNRQLAKHDFKAFITEQFESYSKTNLPTTYFNQSNANLKLNQIEATSPELITAQTTLFLNDQPVMDLEYQFKPSNEIIDSNQTVATYQAKITHFYDNWVLKQLLVDLDLQLSGFINDTGDYYETLTSKNEFKKFDFTVTPSTLKYHRNADSTITNWELTIPKITHKNGNERLEAEGVTYTTNSNELFQFTPIYTGSYAFDIERIKLHWPGDIDANFTPVHWEQNVTKDLNSSYVTLSHSLSLKGNLVTDKSYDIIMSGSSRIEQIDPKLIELASNYQMAMAFLIFYQEKLLQDVGRQMITAGSQIELNDFSLIVNGEPLNVNLHLGFEEPDDLQINTVTQLNQIFKLFNAKVDIELSYQFLAETLEMDHQETAQALRAFKNELNRYNLATILNDDSKNIHIRFEIKQGDFYVDDEKLETNFSF